MKVFNVPLSSKIGSNSELIPYYCGNTICEPGYSWGPGIRDHYLIHYITEGKGIYKIRDKVYELNKGQGFLIYPNDIAFYQADLKEPWTYRWVGFHGIKAASFLKRANLYPDDPVFTYDKDDSLSICLQEMYKTRNNLSSKDVKMTGLLYTLISILIESNDKVSKAYGKDNVKEQYFKKALDYIHMNYSRKANITEIAGHIGINRKYLHLIFKEFTGLSPQDFLIRYKMERASDLIKNESLTIGDIALSVGYDDPLLFSKTFKKIKDISPSEYRKSNK